MSDSREANFALARRVYELWNAGGAEALQTILAPEFVFYEAPEFPDTGVFRGIEEFTAHARDLLSAVSEIQFAARELEASGAYVLVTSDVSSAGSSSGAAVTNPYFQVMRFADGRLTELRSYLDGDQARHDYQRLSAPSG